MVPKTVHEAKTEVIRLYKEVLKARAKDPGYRQGVIVERDLADPIRLASQNLANYNLAVYSLPWFKPRMIAWMVDVKFGDENPFAKGRC